MFYVFNVFVIFFNVFFKIKELHELLIHFNEDNSKQ